MSDQPVNTVPATKPQPVLVIMSIMTGVTFVVGGLAAANLVSVRVIGIIMIVVAGVNQAMAYYLRGQVVPLADVASYVNTDRVVVNGPASRA